MYHREKTEMLADERNHAGSSEMYGRVATLPITLNTRIEPRTPYATSKAAAFWSLENHRNMYGTYAVTAVLFNHESPRRGTYFHQRFFPFKHSGNAIG
jgi:GDPmannose 4,6-dehydratase